MSPSQPRLIRIAGLGICFTLLLLRSLMMLKHGTFVTGMMHALWLGPMAAFVGSLWMSTSEETHSAGMQRLLLAAQSVSVLALGFTMGGQHAGNYQGYLLMVVTLQIALTQPMRIAIPWALVQASTLALAYVVADHSDYITASVSILFKMFTYAIVVTLKRESDARAQFAALNVEMMASRELHAERCRSHERLRISRDLHDVLGHRLTALALNLEIATHKLPLGSGRDEILHAQTITKDLLSEVREVVSTMRPTEYIDLRAALDRVALGFAPIHVHLKLSGQLSNCDASRGEVLVRCAQELITNAVKHARARQVWIDLELADDNVLHLRSRDDGDRAFELTKERSASKGTGLIAMRERFEYFGGTIHASSDPHTGFVIQGALPMLPVAA